MIPPDIQIAKERLTRAGVCLMRASFEVTVRRVMMTSKPITARLGRIGVAFAALVSIAAVATPAAADSSDDGTFNERYYRGNINDCNHRDCRHKYQHHRHRQHDNDGFFSFGLGGPVYSDPPYYYAPAPQYYYPPPTYYQPGPSFNLTIPLGN